MARPRNWHGFFVKVHARHLDRMVSRALVCRRQNTADRRRIAVYAAARGQALLRRLHALIADTVGIDQSRQLMCQL